MSSKYKITIRQTDGGWAWIVANFLGATLNSGRAATSATAREAAERWCDREARTFSYTYTPDPEAYSE